jgi:hypothetical protein
MAVSPASRRQPGVRPQRLPSLVMSVMWMLIFIAPPAACVDARRMMGQPVRLAPQPLPEPDADAARPSRRFPGCQAGPMAAGDEMSSRERTSRGMRKLLAADMSYRPGALCANYRTGADPCSSPVPAPVTGIATARTCSAVGAMSCASRPCSCAAATISASVPRADQPQSHQICLIIEHHRKGRGLRSGCDADTGLARARCRGRCQGLGPRMIVLTGSRFARRWLLLLRCRRAREFHGLEARGGSGRRGGG